MLSSKLKTFGIVKRPLATAAAQCFKITDAGTFCPKELPQNVEEISAAQKTIANMDRSREFSGEQTARMFSGQFMTSQHQQENNSDKDSIEITHGYDMDGNAQMASVVQTNVPEPFEAVEADKLKEGVPEGLSDLVKERGQRWAMEDRIASGVFYEINGLEN